MRVAFREDAIRTEHDRKSISTSLQSWIDNVAPTLADGFHGAIRAEGVPFQIRAWKNTPPLDGCVFKRTVDDDENDWLSQQVVARARAKLEKLIKYKDSLNSPQVKILLLMESEDEYLASDHKFLEAFRGGYPNGRPDSCAILFCRIITSNSVTFLDVSSGRLSLFNPRARLIIMETQIDVK